MLMYVILLLYADILADLAHPNKLLYTQLLPDH